MRRAALWSAPMLLVGCTGASDSASSMTEVTDSAGVHIVSNLNTDAPAWAVDPEPVVDLGIVEGDGPELFFRLGSGRVLANGEIAVVNGGPRELRVFAPDGSHLRSFGREGDGPGEFRGPGRMYLLPGDSIAVWDTRATRLSIFDRDGALGRTVSPDGVGRRPQIVSVLPDGSMLFEQEIFLGRNPVGFEQQYSNYVLYGPTGEVVDSLPRQPRVVIGPYDPGPMAGPKVFDEGTQFTGDSSGYWVGYTVDPELRRYSLDGTLQMLVRWPDDDRTVGPDDSEAALQDLLASFGPGVDVEAVTRAHHGRGVMERYPSHALLVVDRSGMLWVQEVRRPGTTAPRTWRVFDRDGVLSAVVALPRDHRVFDIGSDYILAAGTDDLGVEHVRLFRLSRTSG